MLLRIFEEIARDLAEAIPAPVFRTPVLKAVEGAKTNKNPELANHLLSMAAAARDTRAKGIIARINTTKEQHEENMKKTLGDAVSQFRSGKPFLAWEEKVKREGQTEFERGTLQGSQLAAEQAIKKGDSVGATLHAQRHAELKAIAGRLGKSAAAVIASPLDPHKEKRIADYAEVEKAKTPEPAPAASPAAPEEPAEKIDLDALQLRRRAEKQAQRQIEFDKIKKAKMQELKTAEAVKEQEDLKRMLALTR